MKAMILGLDGATWNLLLPMMEHGKMRNLRRAMEMGSWGVLNSTLPPLSPVSWTSLATGKNPGKHGIVDFTRLHQGRRVPVDSTSIDSLTVWEILSSHGKKVGVVNVPMTYPPRRVDGYMLTGMLTPRGAADSAYPPQLKEEIDEVVGDYVADPYVREGQNEEFLDQILYWAEKKEKVCRYLLDAHDWDFFINVVRAPDLVQHYFYSVLDPHHPHFDERGARRYGAVLERIYEACDQIIGSRLDLLDGNTVLFVISDHGFGPAHAWFEVSRFLIDIGLLSLKDGRGVRGLIASKIDLSVLAKLDLLDFRHRLNTSSRIAAGQMLDKAFSTASIDWSQTKAYCCTSDGKGIRVNLKGREPRGVVQPGEEYEQTRDRLRSELESLQDATTGLEIVSRVYLREECFSGPHLEDTPDLVFSLDPGPYIARGSLSARQVLQDTCPSDWNGVHQGDGILVVAGSSVRSGAKLLGHSILDVAPTVLWATGLPIPSDTDGLPMGDAFDEAFLEANPPRLQEPMGASSPQTGRAYSRGQEEEVLERLRGLGYL